MPRAQQTQHRCSMSRSCPPLIVVSAFPGPLSAERSYVLLETPAALSMRYFGANRIIPAVALAWGITCLFSGFVQNFGGLVATRLILGACEAYASFLIDLWVVMLMIEGCRALFPCLNLLLPAFYLREELAKRTAMIFGASAISSAFGGLLAYGIL